MDEKEEEEAEETRERNNQSTATRSEREERQRKKTVRLHEEKYRTLTVCVCRYASKENTRFYCNFHATKIHIILLNTKKTTATTKIIGIFMRFCPRVAHTEYRCNAPLASHDYRTFASRHA